MEEKAERQNQHKLTSVANLTSRYQVLKVLDLSEGCGSKVTTLGRRRQPTGPQGARGARRPAPHGSAGGAQLHPAGGSRSGAGRSMGEAVGAGLPGGASPVTPPRVVPAPRAPAPCASVTAPLAGVGPAGVARPAGPESAAESSGASARRQAQGFCEALSLRGLRTHSC